MKIKWADFQQSTRSRSASTAIAERAALHEASLALVRSDYSPPPRGIHMVGVTLFNFTDIGLAEQEEVAELNLRERAA